MQKWSCSHSQISGNIRTRPRKIGAEVHTDGYRSGAVKPHPSHWCLATWEQSKTSSHLPVRVCVDISTNSSLMLNSLTASSRVTQKQVTAIVPHHRSGKGMQWSSLGLLPVFVAGLHAQNWDSEASGGTAWKSACKICLSMGSPCLYFFVRPCNTGRDSSSGHWHPVAVWLLTTHVFFRA